jgi:hypothetical protein
MDLRSQRANPPCAATVYRQYLTISFMYPTTDRLAVLASPIDSRSSRPRLVVRQASAC